jgi:hypothetical protein
VSGADIYDRDFHAWATQQAALLRAGRVAELDLAHLAEEIEGLGRGERRELVNLLAVLLLHLLKWAYQPERRGKSWRLTIEEQRRQLARHLRDNPSLRAAEAEAMADAYGDAVFAGGARDGFAARPVSVVCPYTLDQALDDGFWPEPG